VAQHYLSLNRTAYLKSTNDG